MSHEDYAKVVTAVIRRDLFELEECTTLGQMPGVRALAHQLERGIFPTGMAIRHLFDRAVNEVLMLALDQPDLTSQRIASFLHLWYKKGETVVTIAAALDLSRSYVTHTIQRRALDLVAKRFLEHAWRVEASA